MILFLINAYIRPNGQVIIWTTGIETEKYRYSDADNKWAGENNWGLAEENAKNIGIKLFLEIFFSLDSNANNIVWPKIITLFN